MNLVRVIPCAVLFVTAIIFVIRANAIFGRILNEVNSGRAANEQISFLFVNLRFAQVLAEHRQLFPVDDKRRQMKTSLWVGFALLAALAIFLVAG